MPFSYIKLHAQKRPAFKPAFYLVLIVYATATANNNQIARLTYNSNSSEYLRLGLSLIDHRRIKNYQYNHVLFSEHLSEQERLASADLAGLIYQSHYYNLTS